MSDRAKTSVPWGQQGKESGDRAASDVMAEARAGGDQLVDLLKVPCPECGQMLALGREYLGGHCLCPGCDTLMLVSLKRAGTNEMVVVADKVDKMTGERVGDSSSSSSPVAGGAVVEEDWENTRPVKMWQGLVGGGGTPREGEEVDLDTTLPVPKMDAEDDMDLGVTMPVPLKGGAAGGMEKTDDEDWAMTDPVKSQQQSGDEIARAKSSTGTGRQAMKLAPPGAKPEPVSDKAPSPTSGAVPAVTTPPVKAPPPMTGSSPTLESGKIAGKPVSPAQKPSNQGGWPPWQAPGAGAPIGQPGAPAIDKATGEKAGKTKSAAVEKKKSDPFGNQPTGPIPKKKPSRRRRRSHRGWVFAALMFLLMLSALAVFAFAPGLIPRGLEAREFVDGKIDEGREKLENLLAKRAMNSAESADSPTGAMIGGAESRDTAAGSAAGQDRAASPMPVQTRESDLALQRLLRQDGERVIHRFYKASTVEEKLAFVVDPEEARPDMEEYFAKREGGDSIHSILFRGGTRDLETGYYYGVFDVSENENDVPHRWCVVDAGTGLYQLDWILYRQIVASELGGFLVNPSPEGVTKSFHMLLKLGEIVSADDSPWFDEAVGVELQVPLISSAWYPVLMKKPLAESTGLTTKLMDGKMVIAVIEVAWIPGDKDSSKTLPAITAIKRWGAWKRKDF